MAEKSLPFWKRKEFIAGLLFVIIVPVVAHILYSRNGFNPTDDGFILAGSERILDGEVPHKDFISIRTTGSLYMHAPFVALGGDYTIWLSRLFVWFEFAVISWMWTLVVSRSFKVLKSDWVKVPFALSAMAFTTHVFPIMAWHSIDALFVSSIGLVLCTNEKPKVKMLGYLVLGSSILFRQNFVIFVIAGLIVLSDWRKVQYWLMAAIPGGVYVAGVTLAGGFDDLLVQLTTFGGGSLVWEGGGKYVKNIGTALGLALGLLASALLYADLWKFKSLKGKPWARGAAYLLLLGVPAAAIIVMFFQHAEFIRLPSFALFGFAAGVTAYLLLVDRKMTPRTVAGVLVLVNAWSVSLSGGYNTPALGTGPLVLFLAANALVSIPTFENKDVFKFKTIKDRAEFFGALFACILVILSVGLAGTVRMQYAYLEPSVDELAYDLGDVLDGGKLIRTDRNTYTMLGDLQNATSFAAGMGMDYVVVPDLAAVWIGERQRNLIPCDWPQDVELADAEILERVEQSLEDMRGDVMIIVEKYETSKLGTGLVPLSDSYKIVQYVEANFSQVGETEFFILYG
jgi:hypothetical protein